jgi:hypothetical protein
MLKNAAMRCRGNLSQNDILLTLHTKAGLVSEVKFSACEKALRTETVP